MPQNVNNIWENDMAQRFAEALADISDRTQMQNFLRDVMTEKEINEMSARLAAAQMLTDGERYTVITQKTKLSSRTIARIGGWLKNGCNGYQVAINNVQHHDHIPPARVT